MDDFGRIFLKRIPQGLKTLRKKSWHGIDTAPQTAAGVKQAAEKG
jgi:hypothetical protein